MASARSRRKLAQRIRAVGKSRRILQLRTTLDRWRTWPYAGPGALLVGTLLATLFIMAFDRSVVLLFNPGVIYLPVVAMLAYHWKWPLALIGAVIQLFCVYFFFIAPANRFKPFVGQTAAQIIVLAAVMGFVLAIVQLARYGRATAERAAGRFAALNRIGSALVSELDETRLLTQIAETARNLTGASFAAFTLRPMNDLGEPLVPSEGNFFHLAAVVGVTGEQEEFFRIAPLGGEGLLAPIFRHGVPVRVGDALKYGHSSQSSQAGKGRRIFTADRNAALRVAADYAHELRNPLAVVKGFAQMLLIQTARGKGPPLAEWQREAIADIDQGTTRLVELTDDLLDVTRLQAGRLELHLEATDLVALVQRIATRIQVTTQQHAIAIDATPERISSMLDPRRLEQVVTNLITNAIKYSPGGGDIVIHLCEDLSSASVILSVADHGIGIPAHQQGRIFGRFVRADNARASEIGGTGLGLYLCRELVERHQGRIWFESTEGEGSTFFVSLPLRTQATGPASPSPPSSL